MGVQYDQFMVEEFPTYAKGELSAHKRRLLLSKWAGEAWKVMERERIAAEEACAAGSIGSDPSTVLPRLPEDRLHGHG